MTIKWHATKGNCSGGPGSCFLIGACPDTEDSSGACVSDATFVQGFKKDGQQCVVFSRNFAAGELPLLCFPFPIIYHLMLDCCR